jgi:hypothetical protein
VFIFSSVTSHLKVTLYPEVVSTPYTLFVKLPARVTNEFIKSVLLHAGNFTSLTFLLVGNHSESHVSLYTTVTLIHVGSFIAATIASTASV